MNKSFQLQALSLIYILFLASCSSSGGCDDEVLGNYSYSVSTPTGSGVNISGGSTTNARIEKLSEVDEDIFLLEISATIVDGLTCISGFKFLYDIERTQVVEIEEVFFGCDTTISWQKDFLDVELNIDPLDDTVENASGSLSGFVDDSNTSRIGVNYRFDEIPVCLE